MTTLPSSRLWNRSAPLRRDACGTAKISRNSHSIEVRTKREDLTILTREGYDSGLARQRLNNPCMRLKQLRVLFGNSTMKKNPHPNTRTVRHPALIIAGEGRQLRSGILHACPLNQNQFWEEAAPPARVPAFRSGSG